MCLTLYHNHVVKTFDESFIYRGLPYIISAHIVYDFTMHMCKISHDIIRKHQDLGRLKMIHMPLLRLEHISMILQCTLIRFQSRLIIILFCMYISK